MSGWLVSSEGVVTADGEWWQCLLACLRELATRQNHAMSIHGKLVGAAL